MLKIVYIKSMFKEFAFRTLQFWKENHEWLKILFTSNALNFMNCTFKQSSNNISVLKTKTKLHIEQWLFLPQKKTGGTKTTEVTEAKLMD